MLSFPLQCRLGAACLILGAAVLRILYLANNCPLDLAPDEAHYWDWSRHLDWSYYSKGPLIAWIIRASCWLFGSWSIDLVGSEMLAVRLPAVLFGGLLLIGLYVLTVQVFQREGLALALVAVALTMPLIAAGSSLMTIDAPYTCLWGWALVVGHRALFSPGSQNRAGQSAAIGANMSLGIPSSPVLRNGAKRWWAALGLLIGVGILAKYTMVLFVPFLGLFLLATPAYRSPLRGPGFWSMAFVAALCCLPIMVWNAQHDWVTLRHAQGHAGLHTAQVIHWLGPLRYLGTQFGILLGFWFVVWALAMAQHRPGRERDSRRLYLWWLSAPMFLFFGLFSLKNGGGEPNWPVTAYLAGMVLAAGWLAEQWEIRGPVWRHGVACAVIGFASIGVVLTVALHQITWVQPLLLRIAGPATKEHPLPLRRVDPTARLRGWRTLAAAVDDVREELRRQGIEAVIVGGSWTLPGELGFYGAGHPAVYSIGSALGDRQSQYDLWRPNPLADPDAFRGKTFIVVGAPAALLRPAFERIESEREIIYDCREGAPLSRWPLVIGHGYRGFGRGGAAARF